MANLVIVESPNKAGAIRSYLGSNYVVMASNGHIRDLPKSTLGVDIEGDFEPHYINIRGKGDIIAALKKEAKKANKIFLATDPDREGEAISWHLAHVLDIPPEKACRVTFNAITKSVVKEAIKHPRSIDENLVNAQQARRILDRIVGYKLSPFLWTHVKSGLSAGRVQSVATRIIAEREKEIRAFVPKEYWTIDAALQTNAGETLQTHYYGTKKAKAKLSCKADADKVLADIEGKSFTVTEVKEARKPRHPAPPFNTFTMQQEASRKLGFQSQRIMKVAQELYEGINLGHENGGVQGLITYMRTDSLRISEEAQSAALALIEENYGKDYCPASARVYKTKAGAEDAHEAIRPYDVRLQPKNIRKYLTSDQYRLYKLIWERFVASQMASAMLSTVSVETVCEGHVFKASGYTVAFKGYMAVYGDAPAEEENDEDGDLTRLPRLEKGERFADAQIASAQHFTEPPPRYTEASLIKFLDENGIGRPSTITTIITTIFARTYVRHEGKSLVPTPLAEVTTDLMCEKFPEIVDYEFTAQMENSLDSIERGETSMLGILRDFYKDFEKSLEKANAETGKVSVELPPEESEYTCEKCGKKLVYKNGRFGRFLACAGYPECRNTKTIDKNGKLVVKEEKKEPLADFKCENCGSDVVLRQGRYGEFYACVNYPTCKFTRQRLQEIGVDCPDCGAKIVAKRSKKMVFYSCERYPDCNFSSWELPLAEKCPQCGKMLFRRKGRASVYCKDKACGYRRDEKDSSTEGGAEE